MKPKADRASKCSGALWGLYIGDALAMPVHWYYNRIALREDYGRVSDYLTPKHPHPDSILFRSSYTPANARGEILHDQARYWGKPGIHYHQFLQAGENTLNVKLCSVLLQSLAASGGYDPDDYLRRYIEFMTTPGRHRDTYVEECHRAFFANYARGVPPRKCGAEEKHIGGLVMMIPLIVFYHDRPETARAAALEHLALTHPGPRMADAGRLLADLLLEVVSGQSLPATIRRMLRGQKSVLVGHPLEKWVSEPDDRVVGSRLSTACYVEHSLPAVLYLAFKYPGDPETALVVNTRLGGDNVHRGGVLGALLGAENGREGFPRRWVEGLLEPPPVAALKFGESALPFHPR
ncbi:MAG: ADP-ribosylglycohydrolase family protein [Desulfobacterales bacterium]|jgi:ADP-ribosylglycohydrolase|nr:ADP-ribosylglycohydrolase family protein [Desulfobacterales bacterium]MCU0561781.1 ADP-ribosylglycohydrolase family protein [Desulfobacterales bacterium]